MKSDLLIFCTAAEQNSDLYRRRVERWRDQFKGVDADLMCVTDGKFPKIDGVDVVAIQPPLGRPSPDSHVFPGWKRSFAEGIMQGQEYRYLAHVENDVVILNMARFLSFAKTDGVHCGYTHIYNFIESAILILNDKGRASELAHYLAHRLYENRTAESIVYQICTPQISFDGERYEGHCERIKPGHDYIAQYDYDSPIRPI
jgi:hypothetical protein